jgi:hypothetical protein
LAALLKKFEEIDNRITMPFNAGSTTELKEWILNVDLEAWESNELLANEINNEKYFISKTD